MDAIQNSLLSVFQKEAALINAKGEKIQQRSEVIGKISKEAEVKRIIEVYEDKQGAIEEIQYKKASSKYDKMVQKFDSHYSKGQPAATFDVEKNLISITTGATEEVESVQQVVIGVKRLLANCWEAKGVSASDKDIFLEYTKDVKGRRIFADALNHYRKSGLFSMKEKAYPLVCELIFIALNQAQAGDDIDFALTIMVLAQTFFYDQKNQSGGSEKLFLVIGIQKHSIWTTPGFWTKALNVAINEETKGLPSMSEDEKQMIIRNIAFGKLSTVAHNMVQFAIEKSEIENVILGYAKEKGLPEPFIEALKVKKDLLKS